MFNPFKYLINDAAYEAKKELKESLREEIREITKDICIEMVAELFNQNKETERAGLWGRYDKDTVVGKLRKGIAAKVAEDFTKEQDQIAINYVSGEQFIDTVIDRIMKKQLDLTKR